MRILQQVELLTGLLLTDLQRDGVGSGRHKQRNAIYGWSSAPAFRTQRYVWRIGWTGSQFDLRAGFGPQVPPNAIDARLCFAWRTAGCLFTSASTRTTWPSRSPGTLGSRRTAL